MSDLYNLLLIVCSICEFIAFVGSTTNSTASWSAAINLLVDRRDYKNSRLYDIDTRETHGIIAKSNQPPKNSHRWAKIGDEIGRPRWINLGSSSSSTLLSFIAPKRDFGLNSTNASGATNSSSFWSNYGRPLRDANHTNVFTAYVDKSLQTNSSTEMPRKGDHGETGHAFMFDDDDYYDDDDDDEDDDDYEEETYPKNEKEEEIEEVEETDTNAEEHMNVVDGSETQEEDNDNDAEIDTKPSIILRTRRKNNKSKHGKKHGKIKIKKKFKKLKKFMLPLLIAYKLKFLTLVPLLFGILKLIVVTTSFAGFFFALFAVGLGWKNHH